MAGLIRASRSLKPAKKQTPGPGNIGFDNPRENIDPHIRTKAVSTKEATIGGYTLPSSDGTLNQVLTTDGSGTVTWETVAAAAEVNDLTAAVTWANIPDANVPESAVTQHVAAIDHDSCLNFAANEHFTEASIDHTNITNVGNNTHAQIDTAITASTNHIADNTQAHSDYLLNSGADSAVGPITITADNSSADTAYVPMVLYNTDDTPPAASGFPIGTLYVQYTA